MGKIEVLDCTLRDGAYIVESRFGTAAIRGIIGKLQNSEIEIVECGWLKDKPHEDGTSFYHIPDDLKKYMSGKNPACTYVVMIDWDRYDDSVLPPCDGSSVDAVRVVFPHGRIKQALAIAERIRDKGYSIYLQAANTLAYSESDLSELADEVNKFRPVGISIVDTFGAMYEDDLLSIAESLDSMLDNGIKLGFHSHNNQQMAFANSIAFANFFAGRERDVIIDSSLCGMGRGAGNATTELITSYLNKKYNKNYNLNIILDTIDTYMVQFEEHYRWGYSIPYFIAGIYCCHVNNIAYLLNNHRTGAKDMRNIIESLDPSDRLKYDYDLLEQKYVENQSRLVDDAESFDELKNTLAGRKIVLVAPGKSSSDNVMMINSYINDNNAISIAVNAILPGYDYDYLFFSNAVRYDYARETFRAAFDRNKRIILSNVKTVPDAGELIINFNRAIKRGWKHFDNAVICMIRLLEKLGVKDIAIAGFDGFKTLYNESYADPSLPTLSGDIDYSELNDEIKDMYDDCVKCFGDKVNIEFITESYFGRQR